MIRTKVKGSFKRSYLWFKKLRGVNPKFRTIMEKYGDKGVRALANGTPKDTGNTASKWRYKIEPWGLSFLNDNINSGVSVAILLQYGHGTKSGGYIQGVDYINPALRPIFNQIAKELRKEVAGL